MPTPRNQKELQRFLGLANYYRKWILDFSKVAMPLYKLLKKEAIWQWSNECQHAFEKLKYALVNAPVLKQPDLDRPFLLYTDASREGLGCILSQKDDSNREYVCAYYSRSLQGAENNYTIQELECLAVVWGIKQNRIYLYGTKFIVITDHQALIWLKSLTDPNTRLLRWVIFLQEYEFDVLYRKGVAHTNVDPLSRDVLTAVSTSLSPNNIDPYENEALMHFLKFKKHRRGRPSKQCGDIEKLGKNYELINDTVYLRNNNGQLLVIPRSSERDAIIKQAHGNGHFQVDATVAEVKKLYTWPNLQADVEKAVAACDKCQRNEPTKRFFHPARSIPVTGIMDRVQIDLVFGLPPTKDGFVGVFIAMEALSKYPFVLPIKTKAAPEIAKCLLNFISLFGPPKTILSDNGNEFKSVVDELLKHMQVEHSVTAPYYPQCNGLAERFNNTLMIMLRKLCEKAPQTWDEWLPFALMCYRAKVNTTTKYSPDMLMFGRERNPMIDYSKSVENDLFVRTDEINKLHNVIYPEALENISKVQATARSTQDKRNNVTESVLPVGTLVAIRNEGVTKKLEPRFTNKCEVIAVDEFNNYILRDNLGKTINNKFPLSQLKILNTNLDDPIVNDDVYEVDRIVSHRDVGSGVEYLIKWKHLTHADNSWVREPDLDAPHAVNKYWRVLNKQANNNKKKSSVNLAWFCVAYLFTAQLALISGRTLEADFKYCPNPTNAPLLNENLCHPYETLKLRPRVSTSIAILKRLNFDVSGLAFECEMTALSVDFFITLFGYKHHVVYKRNVKLSAEDCPTIVGSKTCNKLPMQCNDTGCFVESFPNSAYSIFETITKEGFYCKFIKRPILADHVDDTLFENPLCTAKNLHCVQRDSIIVWNSSIVNSCPFALIKRMDVFQLGDYTYGSAVDNMVLQVDSQAYNDDVKYNRKRCSVVLQKTFDGYYVAKINKVQTLDNKTNLTITQYADAFLKYKTSNETIMTKLKYDDLSYDDVNSSRIFEYNKMNEFSFSQCTTYSNLILEIAKKENNTFKIVNTEHNKKIIIFSYNRVIRLPLGRSLQSINFYVNENMPEECYYDIPVYISLDNKIVSAYLTDNNIIIDKSYIVPCSSVRRTFQVGGRLVLYTNNQVHIIHKPSLLKVSLQDKQSNEHLQSLFHKFATFNEDDFNKFNERVKKEVKHFEFFNKIAYYWNMLLNILTVVLIAAACGLTYKFCVLTGIGDLAKVLALYILQCIKAMFVKLAERLRQRLLQPRLTASAPEATGELQPVQQLWATKPEEEHGPAPPYVITQRDVDVSRWEC